MNINPDYPPLLAGSPWKLVATDRDAAIQIAHENYGGDPSYYGVTLAENGLPNRLRAATSDPQCHLSVASMLDACAALEWEVHHSADEDPTHILVLSLCGLLAPEVFGGAPRSPGEDDALQSHALLAVAAAQGAENVVGWYRYGWYRCA